MEDEDDSTLDALLMREHGCTKQLLGADQVLRGVIQRDQRITSAWELWGRVLELLGNKEKSCEVMLTGLEWDKMNSFDSVSVCSVVI